MTKLRAVKQLVDVARQGRARAAAVESAKVTKAVTKPSRFAPADVATLNARRGKKALEAIAATPPGQVLRAEGFTITGAKGSAIRFTHAGKEFEATPLTRFTARIDEVNGPLRRTDSELANFYARSAQALFSKTPEVVAEAKASSLGKLLSQAKLEVVGEDLHGIIFKAGGTAEFRARVDPFDRGLFSVMEWPGATNGQTSRIADQLAQLAVKQTPSLRKLHIEGVLNAMTSSWAPVADRMIALGYEFTANKPFLTFTHPNGSLIELPQRLREPVLLNADQSKALAAALRDGTGFSVR